MTIAWPLAGVDPTSRATLTRGGYDYLQQTKEANPVTHTGMDINGMGGPQSDCGAAVFAPAAGVIRYVRYHVTNTGRGFGWHTWLETLRGHWLHFCHLNDALVELGQPVDRGEQIGMCGATAGWDACHLHFEVRDTPPADWDQWVNGWSYARVAREYRDPLAWLLLYGRDDGEDLDVATNEALAAEVARLNSINTILAGERDWKDQLLQAAYSRIGALEHDVIPPLQSEIADVRAQLVAAQSQPAGDPDAQAVESVLIRLRGGREETLAR